MLRIKKEFNLNLKLNSEVIFQSHEERFLGVIMDDKLSWVSHRAAIRTRISRNAGIFFRARHMFKTKTLKSLYFSFIQAHLVFCCSIWGIGSKNSLRDIFVAQKRAVLVMRARGGQMKSCKGCTSHKFY